MSELIPFLAARGGDVIGGIFGAIMGIILAVALLIGLFRTIREGRIVTLFVLMTIAIALGVLTMKSPRRFAAQPGSPRLLPSVRLAVPSAFPDAAASSALRLS